MKKTNITLTLSIIAICIGIISFALNLRLNVQIIENEKQTSNCYLDHDDSKIYLLRSAVTNVDIKKYRANFLSLIDHDTAITKIDIGNKKEITLFFSEDLEESKLKVSSSKHYDIDYSVNKNIVYITINNAPDIDTIGVTYEDEVIFTANYEIVSD